jgi:hypothetical protein
VTPKKILPASAAILPLHDQPSRGQVSTYTELQRKIITTSGCNIPNGSSLTAILRSAIFMNAPFAELIDLFQDKRRKVLAA